MPTRGSLQYDLTPTTVPTGTRWVLLHLKNVGEHDLKSMQVQLNSLDTYAIDVHGTGSFLQALRVGEEQSVPFQVTVQARGNVYATLDGWREDEPFHWESLSLPIMTGKEVAEIVSLTPLTEPYPTLGAEVTVEAVVRAVAPTQNLVLEFWADTPSRTQLSLAKEGTEVLGPGEEERHRTSWTPEEEGIYTLHAYLFDRNRRVDHRVAYLSVTR
ncbi:MAG: hypothetical protein ACLFU8_12720 [Anaerolineales bacterium]